MKRLYDTEYDKGQELADKNAPAFRLTQSHGLLKLLFSITNDVGHSVIANLNLPTFNPLTKDIGCTFVLTRFLTHIIELFLKAHNVIALLFHLAVILVVDGIHDLLQLKLIAHLRLCSPPFAPCLQNVNTSTLGCYQNKQRAIISAGSLDI